MIDWHSEAIKLRLAGMPIRAVARSVGKSHSYVQQYLTSQNIKPVASTAALQPDRMRYLDGLMMRDKAAWRAMFEKAMARI